MMAKIKISYNAHSTNLYPIQVFENQKINCLNFTEL